MSEQQLIDKIRSGDGKAFKQLFDRYYALMCAVSYEYVKDKHLSQNMAEDVMLSVWEKREQLSISVSLKSYLIRSVRNRSIDYLRSQANNPDSVSYEESFYDCFIPDDEVFEQILLLELENNIRQLVENLPPETRTVFNMSRFEDKTYAEIADELHISVNTVKYHIKQALSILRDGLKDFMVVAFVAYFYLFY